MASDDGFNQGFGEIVKNECNKMIEGNDYNNKFDDDDDDDDDYDNEDEDDEETWDEMDAECESFVTCLFCIQNFKTMAVALEHCKTEHDFNLSNLKNKFNMDCYSYICMVNYLRKERVTTAQTLMSFKDPPWLNGQYFAPVIQDDPWLMLDFEGLESLVDSESITPDRNYHVVNSENGLVTLTEQHFVQLQHKIKHLTLQVQEKDEALLIAADQMQKMKYVTQNLICDSSEDKELEKTVLRLKLTGDDGYFNSYSHFGIHHEMLSDKVRTCAYKDAIMNNASTMSGKTILDVGCGTGILSMFAATAGATKVIGVDQSDIIYNAMDIVRENRLSEKIDLLHGKIEDISLPVDKVDVIISEWMGYFLLFEGMFDSVITARDRFLKKDGFLLPNRYALHILGISDSDTRRNMLDFWSDVYGFKMSCLLNEVIREAQISHVQASSVATTSAVIFNLDLYTADINSTNFTADFELESLTDGSITALCGYFDAFFDLPNPVVLSTGPNSENTHWRQTVFFLPSPIPVTKGCVTKGNINCQKLAEDSRALSITITVSDQENKYFLM